MGDAAGAVDGLGPFNVLACDTEGAAFVELALAPPLLALLLVPTADHDLERAAETQVMYAASAAAEYTVVVRTTEAHQETVRRAPSGDARLHLGKTLVMSGIEWRLPFILSLLLLLSACMGPNPWTTDPVTECRSMGFAPDSRQFSECLIVNKSMQRSHAESEMNGKRSNAEIEAAAAQARPRICDPSTGLCTPSLLKPQDLATH